MTTVEMLGQIKMLQSRLADAAELMEKMRDGTLPDKEWQDVEDLIDEFGSPIVPAEAALTAARRKVLVDRCVDDLTSHAMENLSFVREIIREGFEGFQSMNDETLLQSYRDAGLHETFGDENNL